ncbi:cryptochrome DASH [Biomphalaria pfeifferi]|uniref:Cryptochrome DASH n=1 Tax=Biomphalaria pfeifferi TaxID=112525 RepID=A0AAD8ART5_BIOPF|nr:cryptochrome DASH [Biomphalaria pfeifferi]
MQMASENPSVAICLFRNDLRVHDNEALFTANQKGKFLLPLYCFDPRHHAGTYHFGFPKTGCHRLRFLLESVTDLRIKLQSMGSNLIVRLGKPEDVIAELVKNLNLQNNVAVVIQKEVTEEEVKVEQDIRSKCRIPLLTVWGHTLYHIEDLPFEPKHLPDVYTEFRKKVEDNLPVRKLINLPVQLNPLPMGIDQGLIPTFPDFGFSVPDRDPRSAFPFIGGESSALQRLNDYFWVTDNVSTYKETRNGMIGTNFSTKFSPWLAHGCLSPRKIYWELKRYERERASNQSTYWVIFELLWRDYFRYVSLKYGNKIFFSGGIKNEPTQWKTNHQHFKAWQEGRTGVPYIDANMRELAATGFMSNRGRQNVASFLTKDLQLDWRLGAEWFESLLIDHDVCSNYGNWLYSAGIGNDPRENRKFNVVKQGLDYDGDGNYVRLWVPELAAIKSGKVHCIWTLSNTQLQAGGVLLGQTYPNPIIVAQEWSRHVNRPSSSTSTGASSGKGKKRSSGSQKSLEHQGQYPGQKRGLDFYFSHTNPR